jgi:hypothetical protein
VRQRRRRLPGGIQSPNHNLDADTEISPTSHEIVEAITDPNVYDGWFDKYGFEIGGDCAYVWGATAGKFGQEYNQVNNGHKYLTQEELSKTSGSLRVRRRVRFSASSDAAGVQARPTSRACSRERRTRRRPSPTPS